MTKNEILDKFNDIDFVYNDSSKHETLSRMLDELLKEQETVVRCKDCKHKPTVTRTKYSDYYVEFPEGSNCPCQNPSEQYYSWCPDDDWFCADGERKE